MACGGCGDVNYEFPQPDPLPSMALPPLPEQKLLRPTLLDGVMQYPDEGCPIPDQIDGFEKTGKTTFESVMPPCKSRYEVVYLDEHGVSTVRHTCLHPKSPTVNQYVTRSGCEGCPLRKASHG